jgi:hypothetical protein
MLLKKPNTNIFLETESGNDIVRMKGLGWVEIKPEAEEIEETPKPAKKAAKAKAGE